MRKQRSRPPYALLPMLLVMIGIGLWGFGGCGSFSSMLFGSLGQDASRAEAAEYLRQARASLKVGDTRNALIQLVTAVKSLGGGAAAYAAVADDLSSSGNANEAVSLLTTATRDPTLSWSPLLWAALGRAYHSAGDSLRASDSDTKADQAAEVLLTSIAAPSPPDQQKPAAAERYTELGQFYAGIRNNTPDAVKAYRAALNLAPKNPRLLNDLGYILANKAATPADLNEALKLTRQAVMLVPDEGEFRASYGWALFKANQPGAARRLLTEAVESDPDDPDIHYHLGMVCASLGDAPSARLEYDRALLLRPEFADARQAKRALGDSAPGLPIAAPTP